jgi:glucose 1-dehydrogenase
MNKLEGKTALVTGSDSGIGEASAVAFAEEGANVVITYHSDEDGAKQTLQKVEEAGAEGIYMQVDTSAEEEVGQMFEQAVKEFGTVDILMNNAGVNAQGIPVAEMSTDQWDKTIKTDIYGYFFCARRFIKIRKDEGGGGKLINVTSIHEEVPIPGGADYCCAKGAIRNLTRCLALEVAEDEINVNNIAPGMILTPFNEQAVEDRETRDERTKHIPMKRAGNPEDVARVALFLASDDSDYVNGSTYTVDGGLMQNLGQGA